MTISHSGLATPAAANSPTIDIVFPSVTTGQLITVQAAKRYIAVNTAFVAGDCTKQSGTCTLGTIALDKTQGGLDGGGSTYFYVGLWSAIVTGNGSLTIRISAAADAQLSGGGQVVNGNWDSSRVEGTNGATINSFTGSGSTGSTGTVAAAGAAIFTGVGAVNSFGAISGWAQDANYTTIALDTGSGQFSFGSGYDINTGSSTQDYHLAFSTSDNGGFTALVAYKEVSSTNGNIAWLIA